jgi:hypothetical protein
MANQVSPEIQVWCYCYLDVTTVFKSKSHPDNTPGEGCRVRVPEIRVLFPRDRRLGKTAARADIYNLLVFVSVAKGEQNGWGTRHALDTSELHNQNLSKSLKELDLLEGLGNIKMTQRYGSKAAE